MSKLTELELEANFSLLISSCVLFFFFDKYGRKQRLSVLNDLEFEAWSLLSWMTVGKFLDS